MLRNEKQQVREIDKKILEELSRQLEIKKEKKYVLREEEIQKILKRIDEIKETIFLLFQGDFSINEQNIKERKYKTNKEVDLYDRIANKIVLKKVEEIFDKMMDSELKDCRIISVCMDRKLFIEQVISENIERSFIQYWVCANNVER